MVQNTLGIVISYYRNRYNFSLEKMSEGICSVTTLCRVEQGIREIDSLMGECLLGRVGKEVTQFELMLNEADYIRWKKREIIKNLVEKKEYAYAKKEIDAYRKEIAMTEHLHFQFCFYYELQIMIACNMEKSEIYKIAYEALRLTKYNYLYTDVNQEQLYSPMEMRLLLLVIKYVSDKSEEMVELQLCKLLHYVENYYTGKIYNELGVEILLTLIECVHENQVFEKEIVYIDKAVKFVCEGKEMKYVAKLHFMKAQAMWSCCQSDEKQLYACKKEVMMAYCIVQVTEEWRLKEQIERYCEEVMGWQITKLGILLD